MKFGAKKIILVVVIIVVLVVVVFSAWMVSAYNGLVSSEEDALAQWQQVENQYQRKIDLIPQLVNVTEQYTEFEKDTLTEITALRSQWLNASGIDQRIELAQEIDQQLVDVRLTYENYPYLQSIGLVAGLMDELAGTENRITVERLRYNEDVRDHNKRVRSFPNSIVANMFGFEKMPYYDPIPGGAT